MTICYIILALAVLAFFCCNVLKSLHMFQLNSYKVPTHMRWLRGNRATLIPGIFTGGLTALALALQLQPIAACILLAVVFVLFAVMGRPKKAKKPLVYTNRVKRMILTMVIILALLSAAAIALGHSGALVIICVTALCSPFLVLLANTINKPLEKGINRYYINDAKKILSGCKNLTVIGVTGSYGKTSVKYILSTLLQAKYNVLMTPESYNTPMGVVITVRQHLRATHQVFVCEMGARHVGDIKELCDIAHPHMGIITSVGPQHLETFHSIENVKKTKFELADSLPGDGVLFLNGEDANIREHRIHAKNRIISYGLSDQHDYYATDISASSKGTTFTVHAPDGECETFTTKMVGAHNVINIVGAMAICGSMGIPLSKLKAQVRKLEGVPHRLQLIRRGGGITVIDDAYNSNPTGSKAAIDALSLFDGYKILVTPGMVELGDRQAELNQAFGAHAASVCDYVVLVGKANSQSIREGLLSQGYPAEKIFMAERLQDGLNQAYALDPHGKEKIILLENDLPDNF